jgi:hypothetical protein
MPEYMTANGTGVMPYLLRAKGNTQSDGREGQQVEKKYGKSGAGKYLQPNILAYNTFHYINRFSIIIWTYTLSN